MSADDFKMDSSSLESVSEATHDFGRETATLVVLTLRQSRSSCPDPFKGPLTVAQGLWNCYRRNSSHLLYKLQLSECTKTGRIGLCAR